MRVIALAFVHFLEELSVHHELYALLMKIWGECPSKGSVKERCINLIPLSSQFALRNSRVELNSCRGSWFDECARVDAAMFQEALAALIISRA